MASQISFDPRAIADMQKLSKQAQKRILAFTRARLENNDEPKQLGTALTGKFSGLWRYRIGDYRLICKIDSIKKHVLILHVGHRKDIYR